MQGDLNKNTKITEKEILIRKIVRKISDTNNIDEIKNYIVTKVGKGLNAARCFIQEYDFENKKSIAVQNEYLMSAKFKSIKGFNEQSNLAEESSAKELFIYDSEKYIGKNKLEKEADGKRFEEYGVKSGFSLPVKYNDKVLGVLIIHFDKTHAFNDEDIDFARTVTDHVGIALNQAELHNALIQTSANMKALINNMPFMAWLKDNQGRLLVVNEPYAQMCHTNIENVLGKKDLDFFPEELAEKYRKDDIEVMKNKLPLSVEEQIAGPKGIKWHETFKSPVLDDKENVIGTVGIARDITQRKEIELELLHRQELVIAANKRERLLRRITETIRGSLDIDETLKIICEEISKIFKVEKVLIIEFPKDNKLINTLWHQTVANNVTKHDWSKFDNNMHKFWRKLINENNGIIAIDNISESKMTDSFKKTYEDIGTKSIISVSIKDKNNEWGTINLHKTESYKCWTKDEIALLKAIADQVYIAIKQAKLYETTKKQAARERLLREITNTTRSSLDINEIISKLVIEVGKAFKANRCFIKLFNTKLSSNIKYSEYLSSPEVKSTFNCVYTKKFIEFTSRRFLSENNTIYPDTSLIDNDQNIIDDYKKHIKDLDVKSNYAVPIFINDKPSGVIVIHYTEEKKELDHNDIKLLQMIAIQSGIAIEQAELYKKVQENAAKEKILAGIMAVIKSNLKIDEIFLIICSLLTNFYDVNRIIISKFDDKENELNVLKECCKKNNDKNDCKLSSKSKSYVYEKILKNKNLIINNTEESDKPKYFLKDISLMQINSLMMVPMHINENEKGAITIQDNKKNNWQQEDVDFLSRVADYLSIAIKESNMYNHSEFISNVSHELKTPLSIISGYAGALLNLEKPDCETTNRFLQIIKNNAGRLNKLIDNLLFISTIEKKLDHKNMVFEELKVTDLIKNSIKLCDEKIKSKNIKIEKSIENIIIKKANIILLQQLLINLITNAINYSESHSLIRINAMKNGNEILISIEDNGCGIKKEHLTNIFERFYRVDKSRNRETGGTGLGLSISKLICEIHGGNITVESVFGKGSVFTLHLPQ